MSFTYGGVRSDDLAGVTATLTQWPSLGGLELQTVDLPGADGRFYGGASLAASSFVFDVIVEGTTPDEAASRRDAFVGLLDPSRGPRSLVVEIDTDWVWPQVVVAEPIAWDRMTWASGIGYRLRGDVTLATTRVASAREATPTEVPVSFQGSYTLDRGNTTARPAVRATVDTPTSFEVTIGSLTVTVDASEVTAGSDVLLDWDRMRFAELDSSSTRVATLVSKMSTFERPELHPGETTTVSYSRGGQQTGRLSGVTLMPNARRI